MEQFERLHVSSAENRFVGITHTGCEDEAHLLAADIVERYRTWTSRSTILSPVRLRMSAGAIGLFFF
jgi:hypothetical protein